MYSLLSTNLCAYEYRRLYCTQHVHKYLSLIVDFLLPYLVQSTSWLMCNNLKLPALPSGPGAYFGVRTWLIVSVLLGILFRCSEEKSGGDPSLLGDWNKEPFCYTALNREVEDGRNVLAESWCTGRKSDRDVRRHRLIVYQFSPVVNITDVRVTHGDQLTASSTSVTMSCHDYHYCFIPFWGRLVPALSQICDAVHNGLTYSLFPTEGDHDPADRCQGERGLVNSESVSATTQRAPACVVQAQPQPPALQQPSQRTARPLRARTPPRGAPARPARSIRLPRALQPAVAAGPHLARKRRTSSPAGELVEKAEESQKRDGCARRGEAIW
jgi:hypothetical protein